MPTRSIIPISPSLVGVAADVLKWAREFLGVVDERMLRPTSKGPKKAGAVCPFAKPSIEADLFFQVFEPTVTAKTPRKEIVKVVRAYGKVLKGIPPEDETRLKTLLVVFPELGKEHHATLSKVTTAAKDGFVKQGLMLAAFYPGCADSSYHNADFKVSQAPHPLIAIRYMAIHDIYFLASKREWFDEYSRIYGPSLRDTGTLEDHDKVFIGPYSEAREKWQAYTKKRQAGA